MRLIRTRELHGYFISQNTVTHLITIWKGYKCIKAADHHCGLTDRELDDYLTRFIFEREKEHGNT